MSISSRLSISKPPRKTVNGRSASTVALLNPDDPRQRRIDDLKDYILREPAFKHVADRVCALIDALCEELTGYAVSDD